jgi:hypothetical protein
MTPSGRGFLQRFDRVGKLLGVIAWTGHHRRLLPWRERPFRTGSLRPLQSRAKSDDSRPRKHQRRQPGRVGDRRQSAIPSSRRRQHAPVSRVGAPRRR